jgi:hypothetical protein
MSNIKVCYIISISNLERGYLTAIPLLHTHLRDSHTNEPGVQENVRKKST